MEVYGVALEMVRAARPALQRLATRDRDLARQLRRALASVPLNIAEGIERSGKDRLYHLGVAAGSLGEVRACLDVAMAFGDVDARSAGAVETLADRVAAMLYRLRR